MLLYILYIVRIGGYFMIPYPTLLTDENYGWNKSINDISHCITDHRGLF